MTLSLQAMFQSWCNKLRCYKTSDVNVGAGHRLISPTERKLTLAEISQKKNSFEGGSGGSFEGAQARKPQPELVNSRPA